MAFLTSTKLMRKFCKYNLLMWIIFPSFQHILKLFLFPHIQKKKSKYSIFLKKIKSQQKYVVLHIFVYSELVLVRVKVNEFPEVTYFSKIRSKHETKLYQIYNLNFICAVKSAIPVVLALTVLFKKIIHFIKDKR